MRAVYQRELSSYFLTPLGYIYISIFLAISSLIFGLNNVSSLSSDLRLFLHDELCLDAAHAVAGDAADCG